MSGAQSSFSVLASDVVIHGNITAQVDLHLDGRVEGDVTCATLVQGAGSAIRGAVVAESARLSGSIEGSITVKELVVLASARISGDVTYEKLTIEPGGQVDGRLTHRVGGVAPKVELVASN
jgi:cytoskeletal protein CcmA (bactofilin family)